MPDYLTITPAWGMTVTKKCTGNAVAFGDGYFQRSALPPLMETSVAFRGLTRSQATNLKSSFDSWQGIDPFYWRADTSRPNVLYLIDSWDEEIHSPNASTITATFKEQRTRTIENPLFLRQQKLELSPSYRSSSNTTYRTSYTQFRDGYQEKAVDGINAAVNTWKVEFTGLTSTTGNALDDFLTERRGVAPFQWEGKFYTCEQWSIDFVKQNTQNFSAEFVQFFGSVTPVSMRPVFATAWWLF